MKSDAQLQEIELFAPLVQQSKAFARFVRQQRPHIMKPILYILDDETTCNAAYVRFSGGKYHVHLSTRACNDAETVAHELTHCLQMQEGFSGVEPCEVTEQAQVLAGELSSVILDLDIAHRLKALGFDQKADFWSFHDRELSEIPRWMKPQPPIVAVNDVLRLIHAALLYEALYGRLPKKRGDLPLLDVAAELHPHTTQVAMGIVQIVRAIGYRTPTNVQRVLQRICDTLGITSVAVGAPISVAYYTQFERAQIDRYRTITFGATPSPQYYVATSTDGVTWRHFAGPVTSGRVMTEVANAAAAQAAPLGSGSFTTNRIDFPAIIEARFVRVYHRHTTLSYTLHEFYPRRLVQSDDIEAESIKAINIGAGQVTADKISVTQLSAITANIGGLVIDTTGYLWQGTGSAGSPTTGLKIFNSGGVGKLSTYNGGVEQVTLDTDGRLKAGAGKVRLDADGLSFNFESDTDNNTYIRWYYGSDLAAYMYAQLELFDINSSVINLDAYRVRVHGHLNVEEGLNVGIASNAAAGEIKASASLKLNNAATSTVQMRETGNIANLGAAALLNNTGTGTGLVFISDSSGGSAMFALNGTTVFEMSDPFSAFSATSGTASASNVYWSAGNSRYEIENRRGATISYTVWILKK